MKYSLLPTVEKVHASSLKSVVKRHSFFLHRGSASQGTAAHIVQKKAKAARKAHIKDMGRIVEVFIFVGLLIGPFAAGRGFSVFASADGYRDGDVGHGRARFNQAFEWSFTSSSCGFPDERRVAPGSLTVIMSRIGCYGKIKGWRSGCSKRKPAQTAPGEVNGAR
jgi:hypothetical protein